MDKRAEYIEGLRDVADFLAAHPTLPLPETPTLSIYHFNETETISLARKIARQLGSFEKEESSGYLVLRKSFGPVALRFVLARRDICERVVVGTRKVERKIIPPNLMTETVEEEIVEWRCPSLLKDNTDGDITTTPATDTDEEIPF